MTGQNQPTRMWDDDEPLNHPAANLRIDVPKFVTFNLDEGAAVDKNPSPYDVAAICQGGCASGSWMPAVTYHVALANMTENGDEVLQYIEDALGELPDVKGQSWAGMACAYVSTAVELWASSVASELEEQHGYGEPTQ